MSINHVHAELAVIEAETLRATLDALISQGTLPAQTQRLPYPHETHGAFAAWDREQTDLSEELGALLITLQTVFGTRLMAQFGRIAGTEGVPAAISWLNRAAASVWLVDGTVPLVADTIRQAELILTEAARAGHLSMIDEAARQGIRPSPGVTVTVPQVAVDMAPVLAEQSVLQTVNTVAQRAAQAAVRTATLDLDIIINAVTTAVVDAPTAGVTTDLARVPVTRSWSAARVETIPQLPKPSAIYASELLDGFGCGPCSVVDGRDYETLEQAQTDYPSGLYIGCDGGSRCRGTLVVVWDETATP